MPAPQEEILWSSDRWDGLEGGPGPHFRFLGACLADHAVILLSPQERIVGWSPGAERILGYSEADISGQPFAQLFERPAVEAGVRVAEPGPEVGKRPERDERWYLCKDRTRLWGSTRTLTLRDERAGLLGYVKIIRDCTAEKQAADAQVERLAGFLTEQKRAEEKLKKSESYFRSLIEHSWDAVVLMSAAGDIDFVSPAFMRSMGYTADEVIGKSCFAFVHPDDQPMTRRVLGELAAQPGSSITSQYRVQHKNGSWHWLETTGTNLLAEPSVQAIVLNCHEITESKEVERELRKRNDRLRLLAEITSALVKETQPQALIETTFEKLAAHLDLEVYFNHLSQPDGRLRLQYSSGLTDDAVQQVESLAPADVATAGTIDTVQRPTEPLTAFGRRLGLTAFACIPLLSQGRVIATFCFGTRKQARFDPSDLALMQTICDHVAIAIDRTRLTTLLQQQTTELAHASRQKDEFLATLAHELRNPLAPICSALGIMRASGQQPSLAEQARGMAERQVQHMARLIDDLLDVARVSQGKIQLLKGPVDLEQIVHRALEAVRPLIDEKHHEVSVTLPAPPLRLEADATRLEQVLRNLLSNAAKYTEPGGRIWLTAECDPEGLTLRVQDTGIGLAPEMFAKIFDPFVQASRSLDRSEGGLGIGLTLVRRLVELHGGRVEVHSAGLGRGSEFVVHLPAALLLPQTPAAGPAADGVPEHVLRILVVDDNVDAAESLALLARLWGHQAQVAHDGPTALHLASTSRPDMVLLDIGLPGMDGYEVGRRLRAEPALRDVILVAVTGYGQEEDRRRSREAGFDHHLTKPVQPDALQAFLAGGVMSHT
jgi:PAS domain S-box-containing protein